MNPMIECLLADIEEIVRVDGWEDLSVPERAGLFAALKILCDRLRTVLEEEGRLSTYAAEKIFKVAHHGAGVFGFEETGRMDRGAQRQFAYGDLSVLKSEVERLYGSSE